MICWPLINSHIQWICQLIRARLRKFWVVAMPAFKSVVHRFHSLQTQELMRAHLFFILQPNATTALVLKMINPTTKAILSQIKRIREALKKSKKLLRKKDCKIFNQILIDYLAHLIMIRWRCQEVKETTRKKLSNLKAMKRAAEWEEVPWMIAPSTNSITWQIKSVNISRK